MEQGDVPNENYHRDFLMKHFAGVDLRLKSVMLNAKIMPEKGEIHGKEEFEKVSRLAVGMNNLAKPWNACEWSRTMKIFILGQ